MLYLCLVVVVSSVVVVVRVRSDRTRQTSAGHRGLFGQSDDTRTGLHQFRSDAATTAGLPIGHLLRLPMRNLLPASASQGPRRQPGDDVLLTPQ